MSTQNKPTREDFIAAAKRQDWDWVDANLRDEDIMPEDLNWAMHLADVDEDQEVRDLGATYLVVSSRPIEGSDLVHVLHWMAEDTYHIVRYRLAIALNKRRVQNPQVVELYEEALHDSATKADALKYKPA